LDESLLTEREQFWLDFLQPEYNVLKFAYRSTGFQHSPEARELIRQSALGRKHSAETRERISASIKGQDNPFFGRTHSIEVRQKISMMNTLSKIYLYDEFKSLLFIFPSLTNLATLIRSNNNTLKNYIESQDVFRGSFYISKSRYSENDLPAAIPI